MDLDEVRPGEHIVCKIDKIYPYGVTVTLEEYPGLAGFVPLSQIANRWIKNIRNFVRPGQIKVGVVLSINRERKQIDVSFSRMNTINERKKMISWRETKRSQQLLGVLAKDMKKEQDEIWNDLVPKILEKYNSVTEAFKVMLEFGKDGVKEIPEQYREALYKVVSRSMTITKKEIIENVELRITTGAGLIEIKKLFKEMPENKGVEQKISYLGGGKYQLKFVSNGYKTIEKHIKNVNDYLIAKVGKNGDLNIKRRE